MANQSYDNLNEKYRDDIKNNYYFLTNEIETKLILPLLYETLKQASHQGLYRRVEHAGHSDSSCNQELLFSLQRREHWWRAFREALVEMNRNDIIRQLGWDEKTFDFGPTKKKETASYNPPEKTLEEFTQQQLDVYKKQNDLSKGLNPTTDDNNQPEEGRVDPNLLSEKSVDLRRDNVRGKNALKLKAPNLNQEPNSYDDIPQHNALAQNSASSQNPGSAQIPEYVMPKFDSLLSRSHQSLPGNANNNLVMSDLPFNQAANSMGSSVDPTESYTFTPGSVSHPPPSGQLAGLERETGTLFLRRLLDSFFQVFEKVIPLDDCSG